MQTSFACGHGYAPTPLDTVAIYRLSVKTISRSVGRSATAAAAYRAGVKRKIKREQQEGRGLCR